MLPERKSDTVRRLVESGDYHCALKIAKGFRLGISREDSGKMTRAFECINNSQFYGSLGYNTNEVIDEGIRILKSF